MTPPRYTPEQFVLTIREEFQRSLESTGAYTKAGMLQAFDAALIKALLRLPPMNQEFPQ